jgi:cob(I)alamin adenosyltransferase
MIHIYTGNGKGKTTAAIGLALRASGAGLKVYFCQFCKDGGSSELTTLKKLKGLHCDCFGSGKFICKRPSKKEKQLAQKGMRKIQKAIASQAYDMFILDEINIAMAMGLVPSKDVLELLKSIPPQIEVILTGRYAPPKIKKIADLVSEIRQCKHYYRKGIPARKGIEF